MRIIVSCALLFCALCAAAQSAYNVAGIPRPLTAAGLPGKFEPFSGGFTLESGPKTDMYRAPDHSYQVHNATRLMFEADTCFILSARIRHAFAGKWDGGALLIEQDSLTWIKFCFEKDYKEKHRVVSVVTKSISDDCNSLAFDTDDVYYRIARVHDVIYLYCSANGTDWYLVRTLNFPASRPLKVGFLAQSPEGAANRVTFSEISYRPVRVKDFWAGN